MIISIPIKKKVSSKVSQDQLAEQQALIRAKKDCLQLIKKRKKAGNIINQSDDEISVDNFLRSQINNIRLKQRKAKANETRESNRMKLWKSNHIKKIDTLKAIYSRKSHSINNKKEQKKQQNLFKQKKSNKIQQNSYQRNSESIKKFSAGIECPNDMKKYKLIDAIRLKGTINRIKINSLNQTQIKRSKEGSLDNLNNLSHENYQSQIYKQQQGSKIISYKNFRHENFSDSIKPMVYCQTREKNECEANQKKSEYCLEQLLKVSNQNVSSGHSIASLSNNNKSQIKIVNNKNTNIQEAAEKKRKYFVLSQRNNILKQLLIKQKWSQLPRKSENFTLKWSYKEQYQTYEILERKRNYYGKVSSIKAYYNHIKRNLLTTKDGLHDITQKIRESGINISCFIPPTYNLNTEKLELIKHYQRNAVILSLKKYSEYFNAQKNNEIQTMGNLQQSLDYLCQLYKSALLQAQVQDLNEQNSYILIEKYFPSSLISKEHNAKTLVNLPLLFYLIIYGCNIWLSQEAGFSDIFDQLFSMICYNQSIMANFIRFSKTTNPISSLYISKSQENSHYQLKKIITPSQFIIDMVIKLSAFFDNQQCRTAKVGNNIWISKPCAGSRGKGIQIIDKPEKINQLLNEITSIKIIQKYIENVWILNGNMAEKNARNLEFQDKNITQLLLEHSLFQKKFDIRQWVLIDPPNAYLFSHFYLKICANRYDLTSLNSHLSHLSNYSVNKQSFQKQQKESVLSQDEFKKLLTLIGQSQKYDRLKQNIEKRVKLIVEEGLEQSQWIQGTFQIVGFDIVIDQHYNPWIIQCNMSPACQTRTDWLKQMRQQSLSKALSIVLPDSYALQLQNNSNHNRQESLPNYFWKSLQTSFSLKKLKNKELDKKKAQQFMVYGKKIIQCRKK